MRCTTQAALLGVMLSAASSPPAQDEASPKAALPSIDWRVPIHTQADDPAFGAYGIWAAGRGYKVSFHDGMCFYPVLGKGAPRNLPLRWRTTSVRLGATDLLDRASPPGQHHDAWRFEYRSARVSEVYDVRSEGVEQSFVIARPDRIDGDLQVHGRWTSPLAPVRDAVPGSSQAAIRFVDHTQREIVRYGRAIAFDAAGKRVDVATNLDGDRLRLTVPAAWVRQATWPITIDPLLTAQPLAASGSLVAAIEESDVAIALGPGTHRVMTTFSLPSSATDFDTYAVLSDVDFQNPTLVFADLGSTVRTAHPRVAFVDQAGPSGRWTIAMARASSRGGLNSLIRVWLHDGGDTTFQSGSMMSLPATLSGWQDRRPDIGGSRNDPHALVVYETDRSVLGTVDDATETHQVLIDVDAGTFGTPTLIDPSPISGLRDRENPTVSQTSEGAPLFWIVCHQQRWWVGTTDWALRARRVSPDASASANATAQIVGALPGEPGHKIEPSVDGSNTRYGVTYLLTAAAGATSGTKLGMTRFLWAPTASAPTIQWSTVLDTATGGRTESIDGPRVVGDHNAGHWAVAYRKRGPLPRPDRILAARVGYNGAVVETQTVYSSLSTDGAGPSIAFDFPNKRFLLAYGTDAARSPVFGRIWTYPTSAVNVPYGTSCGADFGRVSTPLVGTEFFRVRLTGAMPGVPAVLLVGAQPTSIGLGILGMPGCTWLVDTSAMVLLPTVTDAAGDALVTIPFLRVPGDLYLQWAHTALGANPRNLLMTGGLRSQIR
ncbi:MAG: hypothetical protein AAF628_31895 [Planctomycetota bacterium]